MDKFRVAYFVNQYPKVSHSFIRREILSLERQGYEVQRIALRGWDAELVDEADILERKRTQYVLKGGLVSLLFDVLRVAVTTPIRFLIALQLALRMCIRADRPLPFHLVYLAEACRIVPWLNKSQVRHVHAHFGTNSAEVVMLAHTLGGPEYSFTVHGPEEFDKAEFIRIDEKVKRATFVIAISSFCRSQLYRWVKYSSWHKVHVVHCGLEPSFYDVPVSPISDIPRIVCIGRLSKEKGQLLLIEAVNFLICKGARLELILAGDGEMRAELELLIQQYNLHGIVRITGWISSNQVRDEILAARALVLPSFAEGLPVVIMEAMALRRPVLSTYVGGIPELVRSGIDGWLFPAGDLEALVVALEEFLATPIEKLEKMGESARQQVLKRHSVDTEVNKLAKLFQLTK